MLHEPSKNGNSDRNDNERRRIEPRATEDARLVGVATINLGEIESVQTEQNAGANNGGGGSAGSSHLQPPPPPPPYCPGCGIPNVPMATTTCTTCSTGLVVCPTSSPNVFSLSSPTASPVSTATTVMSDSGVSASSFSSTATTYFCGDCCPKHGGNHHKKSKAGTALAEKCSKNGAASNNLYRPQQNRSQFSLALVFSVFACTFGSSFQFGYHLGNVNAPSKLIIKWYQESYQNLYGKQLADDRAEFYWSISVGILAISAMAGGLASGWFADRFGRRASLLGNNAIALCGAAFLTFAKPIGAFHLFIVGRFVIGFNTGLNTGLAPLYLTEISPPDLRGSIGSIHQLQVTIAILISQLLGLPFIFGTEERWPWMFAFTIIPCLVQLFTLPLCPESPKFTLVAKGNAAQAEWDLQKLRAQNDVSAELAVFSEEAARARSQPKVGISGLFKGDFRWPTIVGIVMMFSNQLTGINIVMFFSNIIFTNAGLKGDAPTYATIAMGALNVVQTVISVYLVDHPRFGRRVLHLGGLCGMFIFTLMLTGALTFSVDQKSSSQNVTNAMPAIQDTRSLGATTSSNNNSIFAATTVATFDIANDNNITNTTAATPTWPLPTTDGGDSLLLPTLKSPNTLDDLSPSELNQLSTIASFASIVFVILFVVAYASGPGSIPWFFMSEVFPSSARGSANSVGVFFNWLSVTIVSISFLPLINSFKQNAFLVFAVFQIVIIIFLFKWMPETKGKSVEQISAEMKINKQLICR